MAPTRPYLPPLSTPKNMTFPSELRERTYTCLDSAAKPLDSGKKTPEDAELPITPPSAYTEFLNTFSPIFASPTSSRANFSKYMLDKPAPSPTSAPPSAASFSSHGRTNSNSSSTSYKYPSTLVASARSIKSPYLKSPDQARRLRLPPPQPQQQHNHHHLYTPVSASPLSACPHNHHHHRPSPRHSPSEWRFQQIESPAADGSFSVRQVVTTTITFRVAPRLAAPPKGKRKRAGVKKSP